MIARFRRPSGAFLGSSVLKESIRDFYLQKKQGWLIRKKHTLKGVVCLEDRDEMGNHSVSWPPIMVYLNGALGATWILTLIVKYFAN